MLHVRLNVYMAKQPFYTLDVHLTLNKQNKPFVCWTYIKTSLTRKLLFGVYLVQTSYSVLDNNLFERIFFCFLAIYRVWTSGKKYPEKSSDFDFTGEIP